MKAICSRAARSLRLFIAGCLLVGCATFEPSAQRQEPDPRATAATPEPSRRWFADGASPTVIENVKYGLQCVFKIAELGAGEAGEGSPPIKYVERVLIRDTRRGGEATYAPAVGDADALSSSQEYFGDVWSPDGEYLVLPLSPFDGFCVIKSKGALKTVRRRRCDDFIRVLHYRPPMEVREVAYYHEWGKWETGTAFSFKAGLHGDRWTFVYDAARKELYDGEARSDDYLSYLKERVAKNDVRVIGESKKGRIEITRSFRNL